MRAKAGRRPARFGFLAGLGLLLGVLLLAVPARPAFAASGTAQQVTRCWKTEGETVSYINRKGKKATGLTKIGRRTYYFDRNGVQRTGWRKIQKHYYYFYPGSGKKGYMATGLTKIGKRTYYFSEEGIQQLGWQKIDGSYYYFRIANRAKGFMVTGETVNGIVLRESGRARKSGTAKEKLKVLVKAQKAAASVTDASMTQKQKLKAVWDYTLTKFSYRGGIREFYESECWDQTYALQIFETKRGNCYAFGAVFAYLANAVGYTKCYAVSSGGHGWAQINGRVYDPTWAQIDTEHSYYALSYRLSGVDGRPDYADKKVYVRRI